MKFNTFQHLLNSEGYFLSLVENEDSDTLKERLYIQGSLNKSNRKIISKINDTALNLFFTNKISLKELFLLRNDEPYIIIDSNKNTTSNIFTDKDLDSLMSEIHCGDHYYYSFSEDVRCISPQDAMKYVDLIFINGLGCIERS